MRSSTAFGFALTIVLFGLAGCIERPAPDVSARPAAADSEDATFPRAPAFTRTTLSGTTVSMDDWRGRVVVLNFWATWCGPCRAEIPEFITLQRAFGADRVRFVGVALDEDGAMAVRPYAREMGINYPLITEDARSVAQAYGGHYAVPTTFVIDQDGRIRQRYMRALSGDELRPVLQALLNDA
jgi:cytochrome c biogenesis protein CcmG/thiol:disulfide interchange protein DsbE